MRLKANSALCTGCRACVVACAGAHYKQFSKELSRISILKLEEKGVDVPIICRQCNNAACINACPVDALYKDEHTGAVLVHAEKCIGCGACADACPFGAAAMGPDGLAMICDLCQGSPKCVAICPVNALACTDTNKGVEKKRADLANAEARTVMKKWGIKE